LRALGAYGRVRGMRIRRSPVRASLVVAVAAGLVFASVASAGASPAGRASAQRVLTLYSVATGLQYINSADDSARGKVNNPLGNSANALEPRGAGGNGDGPFAGDIAIYSVNLFSDSTLKQHAGTGVYTCYFNYDQHALCQAYYQPKAGGTLVASGPVDFKTSGFTIVITGGTNTFLGARGEVNVGPSMKKNTQRVDFELIK
jgi:hypothetical protein